VAVCGRTSGLVQPPDRRSPKRVADPRRVTDRLRCLAPPNATKPSPPPSPSSRIHFSSRPTPTMPDGPDRNDSHRRSTPANARLSSSTSSAVT
jgi:hypothetical protein